MRPDITLIATIIGSVVFSLLIRGRQRDFLTPWVFAYYFLVVEVIGSVGGVFHFLFTSLNFVVIMFLCNGFKSGDYGKNPVFSAFLIWNLYTYLPILFGPFPYLSLMVYSTELLKTFVAGYFVALWICKTEGGMRRLLFALVCVAVVTVFYYWMHGGFAAENLDQFGRAALDENKIDADVEQNVNYTALCMCSLLPFVLLALLTKSHSMFDKLVQLVAGCCLVLLGIILIRTGARNGGLAFFPCGLYFIFSSPQKYVRMKRIALFVLVSLIFVVATRFAMKGSTGIRSFNFSGDEGLEHLSVADRMTTGRISMWQTWYDLMTPAERWLGAGFDTDKHSFQKLGKVSGANFHSIIFSVFHRSGYLGVFLFFVFCLILMRRGIQCGERGRTALMFFGVWFLTGIGESWGVSGGMTGVLAGFAMGLCTRRQILNSELWGSGWYERHRIKPPMRMI